jgi:hypothetical protein
MQVNYETLHYITFSISFLIYFKSDVLPNEKPNDFSY